MAHAATHRPTLSEDVGGFTSVLAQLRQRWADYRSYRATLAELQALSDRDLADLGLSRLVIADVARASVYGK